MAFQALRAVQTGSHAVTMARHRVSRKLREAIARVRCAISPGDLIALRGRRFLEPLSVSPRVDGPRSVSGRQAHTKGDLRRRRANGCNIEKASQSFQGEH